MRYDLSKPLFLGKELDLVVSLEVAEHISADSAGVFLDSLVRLGPVLLLSGAIPFQGGTYHVNEQWPEHWVNEFQKRGYVVIDCLRRKIWQNPNVDPWYAQYMFVFCSQDKLAIYPLLRIEFEQNYGLPPSGVHPRMWASVHDSRLTTLLPHLFSLLPLALRSSLKRDAGGLQWR